MAWTLHPISVTTPKPGRRHRRNPRDPRHKSYRRPPSPLPLILNGPPREIPLEYNPVAEAKPPVRKPGPELRTKHVDYIYLTDSLSFLINIIYVQSTPNLASLMKQMEAIHAPPKPTKKNPIKGAIFKGQKRPKGSINIPKTGRIPLDTPPQHRRGHTP